MIICPSCGANGTTLSGSCPSCGFLPERVDGFVAWNPEFARLNDGFLPESFEGLMRVEARSFWFRSRNAIILWVLRKYVPEIRSLLEVGCGTGFVLSAIAKMYPTIRVTGSEIYTFGLELAAQRVPKADLVQMDARCLPFVEEFDVVAAFDVIEHIDEDELVLKKFYRAIKPGGTCLITVPQHQWLWSPVDEEACHKRRYHSSDLHLKMETAGFRIVRSTSFVTLLLPLMLLSRFASRKTGKTGGSEALEINSILDKALEAIMRIEHLIIKWGISFPVGGSRLVVARREA